MLQDFCDWLDDRIGGARFARAYSRIRRKLGLDPPLHPEFQRWLDDPKPENRPSYWRK